MTAQNQTRTITKEVRIAAPLEVVWKALTEGEELKRWFPVDAKVTPGAGGSVWMSWGPGFEGSNRIEIYEPNRHLRTVNDKTGEGAAAAAGPPLTVDYYLSSEKGDTVLRLVHSGFGASAEWGDEYDSYDTGWGLYVLNLKHMLERESGRPLTLRTFDFWPVPAGRDEAWRRLDNVDLAWLRATPDVRRPPRTLALVAPGFGLIRITLGEMGGSAFLGLEIYAFGVAPDQARATRERLIALLEAVHR